MVDLKAAARTQAWVDEARSMGGKVLLGGTADGSYFPPTVLIDTPGRGAGLPQRGVRSARRRLPLLAISTKRSGR